MKEQVIRVLKYLYLNLITKPSSFIQVLKHKELTCGISYYPEYTRRSKFQITAYQIQSIFRYAYPDNFLFLYGLDTKERHKLKNTFVSYPHFMKVRNELNILNGSFSHAILRDKSIFNLFAEKIGIPTPVTIGHYENGNIHDIQKNRVIPLSDFLRENQSNLFFKSISGECADDIFFFSNEACQYYFQDSVISHDEILSKLAKSSYIIQEQIQQHSVLEKLNSSSVNTLRIVTVRNGERVNSLPIVLKIGLGKNKVDNWRKGGVIVGVDQKTNKLFPEAFHPPFPLPNKKTSTHPQTGQSFSNIEIPFIKDAIELASSFHSQIPKIHSIGWDVAITEQGPLIIEGNDNWEISMLQICHGGLRESFEKLFLKTTKNT